MPMKKLGSMLLLVLTAAVSVAAQDRPEQTTKKIAFAHVVGTARGPQFGPQMTSVTWAADGVNLKIGSRVVDPVTGEPTEDGGGADRPQRPRRPEDLRVGRRVDPRYSPDNQLVAWVKKDNNLYVKRTGGDEVAVSTDGSSEIRYGKLDWVYQEEVYGRSNFNAKWWGPNSNRLAYMRVDGSPVHEFTVVDHVPNRLELEVENYPKAGDPNPLAALGVFDVSSGKTTWLDLSKYEGEGKEFLIVHVGWNPSGDKVVFQVQNRIQNWLDLNLGDPTTGKIETVIHEEAGDNGWVNRMDQPTWLADGTFLWWSERTGYKHIYRYRADGTLVNAVTSGPWPVSSILRLDEEAGQVWFTAKKHSAIGSHAFRVDLDGKNFVDLTPERGTHRVMSNAAGTLLIDRFSSLANPGKVVLRDADGKPIRALAEATFETDYGYRRPEYVEISARDGFPMDATVLKPHDFDPQKTYPVMLLTYSGPDSPSVRDRWSGSVWHQFLAQSGIIVLQVNNRTSSGKGQVYTAKCYRQFGISELADLEDAVDWLCKNPWADGSRVGIGGWSYGGFMAAFALTHSKKFALGLAGAGVYDWGLYDTIYTERYMSTPQLNSKGYESTSVVRAAKNLHGHLQIVHGTMDDNVHMQNAMQLVYELQKAGKDFEFMLYPRNRHGIGGGIVPQRDRRAARAQRVHLRRLNWNAIRKVLLEQS